MRLLSHSSHATRLVHLDAQCAAPHPSFTQACGPTTVDVQSSCPPTLKPAVTTLSPPVFHVDAASYPSFFLFFLGSAHARRRGQVTSPLLPPPLHLYQHPAILYLASYLWDGLLSPACALAEERPARTCVLSPVTTTVMFSLAYHASPPTCSGAR